PPYISVMRPFGRPPTPKAKSNSKLPVDITSTSSRAPSPWMTVLGPNCLSNAAIANSTALILSSILVISNFLQTALFSTSHESLAMIYLDQLQYFQDYIRNTQK